MVNVRCEICGKFIGRHDKITSITVSGGYWEPPESAPVHFDCWRQDRNKDLKNTGMLDMKLQVYISYAMQFPSDRTWKSELKALGAEFINWNDPEEFQDKHDEKIVLGLKEVNDELEKFKEQYHSAMQRIVINDLELVRHSDALVVRWCAGANLGAGVKGEMSVARHYHIPVIMILPQKERSKIKVPLWVIGCTTDFVESPQEAIQILKELKYGHV